MQAFVGGRGSPWKLFRRPWRIGTRTERRGSVAVVACPPEIAGLFFRVSRTADSADWEFPRYAAGAPRHLGAGPLRAGRRVLARMAGQGFLNT